MSRGEIYEKMNNKIDFLRHGALNGLTKESKKRTKLFCKYHKDHGHEINNSRELTSFIEDCIKVGKLKEFVAKENRRHPIEKCKG